MRDLIQKVFETEQEAKEMVEAAKHKADAILAAAQEQRQEIISRTKTESQTDAARVVEVAVQEAEQTKRARLAGLAAEIEAQVWIDEDLKEKALVAVIQCVSGTTSGECEGLCCSRS